MLEELDDLSSEFMSKDISSIYTKEKNIKEGRNGYGMAHREKVVNISPKHYGAFLLERKRGGRK